MTSAFEESLRVLLKTILIDVAKEVLPSIVQPNQQGSSKDRATSLALLRSSEVAKALAISEKTLSTLTKTGQIPCIRIGRLIRYDPVQLRKWITSSDGVRVPELIPTDSGTSSNIPEVRQSKPRLNTESPSRSRKAKPAKPVRSPKTPRISQAESNSTAANQPRNIRTIIASRIGVDPEDLPVLTNGKIMQIAGVDIPTLHGWTYLNRDMPEEAFKRLEAYFTSENQQ